MTATKIKVLIIEDETPLLDSYAEVLTNAGCEVVKAVDGYKALEILKASHENIHVILMDLMMPGIDGLEVLRTINGDKDAYGSVPTIVLTNMTSDKVVKEAFDLGAVSYLVKSELGYEDLVNEIKKVVGK